MTETMAEMREYLVAYLDWYCRGGRLPLPPPMIPNDWWPVVDALCESQTLMPQTVARIMGEIIRRWGDGFAPLEVHMLIDDAVTQFWQSQETKA